MKRIFKFLFLFVFVVTLCSCTDNQRAKHWGGNIKIELPAGKRLVTTMFDEEGDLWYLTEDMPEGYQPQEKVLQEYSKYGIFEGSIYFKEKIAD